MRARRRRTRSLIGPAAVAAVMGLTLAACGSDDDGGSSPDREASSTSPAAASGLAPPSQLPTLEEMYKGGSTHPPTSGPPPAKGKTVWFVPCSSTVYECHQLAVKGQEAARLLGWNAKVISGQYNTAGAYARVINQAVAQGVDGIVVDAFGCTEAEQPLRQARAKGISIAIVESSDCDPPVANAKMIQGEGVPGNDAWDYQNGVQQAAYIINKTGGKARILASHGEDAPANVLAYKGFTDTLAKHCPGCKIVNSFEWVSSDFVSNGPWIQALRAQLTRYGPQADSVLFEWDVMVELGGAQAVRTAGMKDALVLGTLGRPPVIEAIKRGEFTAATGAMSLGWTGYASVDNLNRAFNDKPPVPQGLGFTVIDKDHNLPGDDNTFEPEGIDWRSAYLKLWGVEGT